VANNSKEVFQKALLFSSLLVGVIALIGGALGLAIVGIAGLISALLGAAIALLFTGITILSIWLGGRLPLNGFFGLVLGGWLLKMLLFAVLLGLLQAAVFISGPVFFFALVTAVLGGLAVDSWVVLKARLPIIEN
jgi:hypothetical protein